MSISGVGHFLEARKDDWRKIPLFPVAPFRRNSIQSFLYTGDILLKNISRLVNHLRRVMNRRKPILTYQKAGIKELKHQLEYKKARDRSQDISSKWCGWYGGFLLRLLRVIWKWFGDKGGGSTTSTLHSSHEIQRERIIFVPFSTIFLNNRYYCLFSKIIIVFVNHVNFL